MWPSSPEDPSDDAGHIHSSQGDETAWAQDVPDCAQGLARPGHVLNHVPEGNEVKLLRGQDSIGQGAQADTQPLVPAFLDSPFTRVEAGNLPASTSRHLQKQARGASHIKELGWGPHESVYLGECSAERTMAGGCFMMVCLILHSCVEFRDVEFLGIAVQQAALATLHDPAKLPVVCVGTPKER